MPALGEESVASSHTHFAPAGPQGLAGALFFGGVFWGLFGAPLTRFGGTRA